MAAKNTRKDRFTAQEDDFVFEKKVVNGKEVKQKPQTVKKPADRKPVKKGGK